MAKKYVALVNPLTGEIKKLKVGFDWTIFFFANFLGLPLFLRKLWVWGGVMIALFVYRTVITTYVGMHAYEYEQAFASIAESNMSKTPISDEVMVSGVVGLSMYFFLFLFYILLVAVDIYLGRKVSKMTAIKLLEDGWLWAEQDTTTLDFVRQKWLLNGNEHQSV